MQHKVQNIIKRLPQEISGSWIARNSGYERDLCKILNWDFSTARYYDALCDDVAIEIKKGKSIWLDLVRYSEIFLGEGTQDTITAFFIPNSERSKIQHVYFVDTRDLMTKLNLSNKRAEIIVAINKDMLRSLNMQVRLTVKDIKDIAIGCVDML